MKVGELVALLGKLDQDTEVIMSKDSEGNSYSPLGDVDINSVYVAETTWYGQSYSADWSADDVCMTEDEWEALLLSKPRSVTLFPVN